MILPEWVTSGKARLRAKVDLGSRNMAVFLVSQKKPPKNWGTHHSKRTDPNWASYITARWALSIATHGTKHSIQRHELTEHPVVGLSQKGEPSKWAPSPNPKNNYPKTDSPARVRCFSLPKGILLWLGLEQETPVEASGRPIFARLSSRELRIRVPTSFL